MTLPSKDTEDNTPRRVLTLAIDLTPMNPFNRLDTHLEVDEGLTIPVAFSLLCELQMALGGWAHEMAQQVGTRTTEVTGGPA